MNAYNYAKKNIMAKEFKQETPRDQLVTIIGAAQGQLLNLEDIVQAKHITEALKNLEKAQDILREFKDLKSWENK
jgi:flagellin-specific chaperone FliS